MLHQKVRLFLKEFKKAWEESKIESQVDTEDPNAPKHVEAGPRILTTMITVTRGATGKQEKIVAGYYNRDDKWAEYKERAKIAWNRAIGKE